MRPVVLTFSSTKSVRVPETSRALPFEIIPSRTAKGRSRPEEIGERNSEWVKEPLPAPDSETLEIAGPDEEGKVW